ncbi:PadR family transcriptional regulator [Lactiplantibacillus plajomi]|uniref:PadR family transcriptional regulator n=1 Tax=Lactiplantibacillus plajomi TaxID=1457217 RepID=A0ABV6K1A8_9LACO|nr:helix-turn-helix transcriptional regulator [Lactiplantibacillus plajomi]
MTETAFYILLSLLEPRHGYGIIQHVQAITNNRIILGAGTVYGTLKKFRQADLIELVSATESKKKYQVTAAGRQQLQREQQRLQELLNNAEVLNHAEKA